MVTTTEKPLRYLCDQIKALSKLRQEREPNSANFGHHDKKAATAALVTRHLPNAIRCLFVLNLVTSYNIAPN